MQGILRGLIFITASFILSSAAMAEQSKEIIDTKAFKEHESVLPPGARIVAGDLSKNEFYIVGKSVGQPVKQVPVEEAQPNLALNDSAAQKSPQPSIIENKAFAKKVKVALIHPRIVASKTVKPHVKSAAIKKHVHVTASKKVKVRGKLALNKVKHTAHNKKSSPALKTALRKSKHKVASKKNASKVKVALN